MNPITAPKNEIMSPIKIRSAGQTAKNSQPTENKIG